MNRRIKPERKRLRKENRERKSSRNLPIKVSLLLLVFVICAVGALFGINAYVKKQVEDRIVLSDAIDAVQGADCIMVLGCLVKDNGEPSHMLEDRLKRAVELYHAGVASKLLMTGDHGRTDYNEVETMKQYAIEQGVPAEDIFMDHAGFSTYESCYRAKEIFAVKKAVIVTQEYHLYRALYVAEKLGLEVYGVSSDYRSYYNQQMRDIREVLARVKDFFYVLFRPEPTYLGEQIPITGDGNITND